MKSKNHEYQKNNKKVMSKNSIFKIATILILVISIISCSPEDGKPGIQGAAGTNGTNGTNATVSQTGIEVISISPQTIPQNVDTKLDFSLENTDDANAFDLTTDEWTIPSTGFYHIYSNAQFRNPFTANTTVEIVIFVNNSLKKIKSYVMINNESFDVAADLSLMANDKVTVKVYHTGTSSNILKSTGTTVYLSGYKIY